jgi:hypothetical protein
MFALAALLSLITQVSGTPYIPGGDTPAGTDCSGLASWVANVASGRPAFGSRFNTGNMEGALLARGFHYGTAPNSVVIGWNGGHAAVTLPDGTPVSSGESGTGVRIGGGGAYQPQFSRHMYLPVQAQEMNTEPTADQPPVEAPPADVPPGDVPPVDVPPVGDPAGAPAPPPPADPALAPAPQAGIDAAAVPPPAAPVDAPVPPQAPALEPEQAPAVEQAPAPAADQVPPAEPAPGVEELVAVPVAVPV